MSVDPFRRLVKLVARAFYDEEIPPKGANRSKSDKSDNRGIAVVVLDALTRRQWVKEEDLARDLRLHPKQLRRTLRVLEEELLILREHRKESVRGAKVYNAALAVVNDQPAEREGGEKVKVHTHSYCCLDYAQVYDAVRYRIHRSKKKIKDELEDRNTIQEYICPRATCGRRYSALDALRLINIVDGNFHCEVCDHELVAESDQLAAVEMGEDGDGDENARRRRREKLKELYEKLEKQLKPLQDQLTRVKDLTPPDFGSLEEWEKRILAAGRNPNGDASLGDAGRAGQRQGASGIGLPFLGETKVEVDLAGGEAREEDTKEGATESKVLPPWMIRQGMQLTASQRGEVSGADVKGESGIGAPGDADAKDAKEVAVADGEQEKRRIQDEYMKAYYAALYAAHQQQQEQVGEAVNASGVMESVVTAEDEGRDVRMVGTKAKREEEEEEKEEEVEWEEDAGIADDSNGALAIPQNSSLSNGGVRKDDSAEAGLRQEQEGEEEEEEDVDWE